MLLRWSTAAPAIWATGRFFAGYLPGATGRDDDHAGIHQRRLRVDPSPWLPAEVGAKALTPAHLMSGMLHSPTRVVHRFGSANAAGKPGLPLRRTSSCSPDVKGTTYETAGAAEAQRRSTRE